MSKKYQFAKVFEKYFAPVPKNIYIRICTLMSYGENNIFCVGGGGGGGIWFLFKNIQGPISINFFEEDLKIEIHRNLG